MDLEGREGLRTLVRSVYKRRDVVEETRRSSGHRRVGGRKGEERSGGVVTWTYRLFTSGGLTFEKLLSGPHQNSGNIRGPLE